MTTPQERAEHLNVVPYKCYHCEGLLGMHNNIELFVGAAIFPKSVTIRCGYCKRHTFWKPENEKIK